MSLLTELPVNILKSLMHCSLKFQVKLSVICYLLSGDLVDNCRLYIINRRYISRYDGFKDNKLTAMITGRLSNDKDDAG